MKEEVMVVMEEKGSYWLICYFPKAKIYTDIQGRLNMNLPKR